MLFLLLSVDTTLIDSLWETARLWRAGVNVKKVDSARNAIISMGGEAVRYVILRYLPEDDHLQTRAIRDICLKVPDTCAPAVGEVLLSRDTIAQKNALYVASEVTMPSLEPVLLRLLKRKKDKRWISRTLRALYKSGSKNACRVVPKYANHPYEYVRMRALMLVGKYGCKEHKELLWKGLNDPYFMVRDAARDGLVKVKFTAEEVIENLTKVRRIEIFKLLSERCPDKDLLFKVKPTNPFERYWYGKIKCE